MTIARSKAGTDEDVSTELIPFSNDTTQIDVAAVTNVLKQVNSVVQTATSQVKTLVGQPEDQIRGGKDDNTLYYATFDFITVCALNFLWMCATAG